MSQPSRETPRCERCGSVMKFAPPSLGEPGFRVCIDGPCGDARAAIAFLCGLRDRLMKDATARSNSALAWRTSTDADELAAAALAFRMSGRSIEVKSQEERHRLADREETIAGQNRREAELCTIAIAALTASGAPGAGAAERENERLTRELAVPPSLADAIAYIQEARESHVQWAEHLEAHEASGVACPDCSKRDKKYTRNAAEEREWVRRYDVVLTTIRWLNTLHEAAEEGINYTTRKLDEATADLAAAKQAAEQDTNVIARLIRERDEATAAMNRANDATTREELRAKQAESALAAEREMRLGAQADAARFCAEREQAEAALAQARREERERCAGALDHIANAKTAEAHRYAARGDDFMAADYHQGAAIVTAMARYLRALPADASPAKEDPHGNG